MKQVNRIGAVLAFFLILTVTFAVGPKSRTRPKTYGLDTISTFQRGCFPPCMCPVMESNPVKGTLVLVPGRATGGYRNYAVKSVNWVMVLPDQRQTLAITGSGTYRITDGAGAHVQQMTLDLRVGSEPTQRFDSGLVAGGNKFPNIDIVLSVHGVYCFDSVITLHARPLLTISVGSSAPSWEPLTVSISSRAP